MRTGVPIPAQRDVPSAMPMRTREEVLLVCGAVNEVGGAGRVPQVDEPQPLLGADVPRAWHTIPLYRP